MSGVLGALGGKLVERWVSLVALPGTLFLGTAWAAHVLGPSRPFDFERLVREVERYARWVDEHGAAGLFLILVGLLLLAVVPGLIVQVLARVVQVVWLGPWPGRLGGALVERRREQRKKADAELVAQLTRYEAANLRGDTSEAVEARAKAEAAQVRRDRIGLVPPGRPTVMGDRIQAVEHRIGQYYSVPFAAVWPRLWLTAPEADRNEVRQAAGAFESAARLCGWGLLYAGLGAGTLWWPAFVAGAVTVAVSWWVGRERLFVLAELVEALVDLRLRSVARAVGLAVPPGPVDAETGQRLGDVMRRNR